MKMKALIVLSLALFLALSAVPAAAQGGAIGGPRPCNVWEHYNGQSYYIFCPDPFQVPPPPDPWGTGEPASCYQENAILQTSHQCTRTVGGVLQDGTYEVVWICRGVGTAGGGKWAAISSSRCQ